MSRVRLQPIIFLLIALVCSVALAVLTITPPMIPADWARLDSLDVYLPPRIAYQWPSYAVQVALWLAMVAALWWGTHNSSPPPDPLPASQGGGDKKRGRDVSRPYGEFWVVLVTLVGFGLRVYRLTQLPLIVDEIGFAAHASDILHGQLVPIFAPGHNANPSTYSWLVAGAMAIFGQNAFAIRLIPLAFGTLTIPAAYVLGREWWSKRVGFLAAAFVATFPLHVFYSRMSLYNIADPFFAMLALAFLARGLNSRQPTRYFVLAGMTAGVAQYFYHGSRLVPVLIAVYVVIEVGKLFITKTQRVKDTKGIGIKGRLAELLPLSVNSVWMLFAFGVMALPRYAPLFTAHLPITGNNWTMRLPNDMGTNTVRAFLAWVGQRDTSPFWISSQPMLLWPAVLAFLLGVWFCLRHWRDPRSIVLLLSIVLTSIFGGAIWTAAPLYVRYMATLPTIALLVAVGVEGTFLAGKSREHAGGSETLPYIGYALMVVIVGYGSYVSVFVHPADAMDRTVAGQWEEDALAKAAAYQPPGLPVVLKVSPEFDDDPYYGPLELMSMADYVAAYGERRAVIVNRNDAKRLEQQMKRIGNPPYAVVCGGGDSAVVVKGVTPCWLLVGGK